MSLTELSVTPKNITKGIDIIRQMRSLKRICIGGEQGDNFPSAEFWKKYDAGEFGKLAYLAPAFQLWIKDVQALPAEKQVEAVAKKLMELNPRFDGVVTGWDGSGTPEIENGVVTRLRFSTMNVADISPVRALVGLKKLNCAAKAQAEGSGRLTDLLPLQGMKLDELNLTWTSVKDLTPLRGMPFQTLWCGGTQVSDITPLQECKKLVRLEGGSIKVAATSIAALQKALPNCKIEWDDPAKVKTASKVDLLAIVDLKRDAVVGEWKLEDGCLISPPSGQRTRLQFPYTLPEQYVLEAEVERLAGIDCLKFGIVVDGNPVMCQFEGGNKRASGLELIDGKYVVDAASPARYSEPVFHPGKTTTLRITVRKRLVKVECDGKVIVDWRDDPKRFSVRDWSVPDPRKLWTGSWESSYRICKLTVMPLDDAGPAASASKLFMLDPAFHQWVNGTQGLAAEQQVQAVTRKLVELNPDFDGKVTKTIENGVVTEFAFVNDSVADISPVRALARLKTLGCSGSGLGKGRLADLSPLKGMELENLYCGGTNISDLSPLRGMPLSVLFCGDTPVHDLSPLAGMSMTRISCHHSQVSDLSPLDGMQLTEIVLTPTNIINGLDIIRRMQSLKRIGTSYGKSFPTEEFWKKYDAGEFGKRTTNINDPTFQQWMKSVAVMPAEKQIEAVSKKLMELNPGFDGNVTGADVSGKFPPKIENGVVTDIGFLTDNVIDISPVRALAGLKNLVCRGSGYGKGELSDLSPLRGMPLTKLNCNGTKVFDLLPLKQMKLKYLNCGGTSVTELLSLQGMNLSVLDCKGTQISDLSPLQDCKSLEHLIVNNTKVTPTGVAALQKAVPNCKIYWDDSANPKTPEAAASGTK
jgi:Leucine-rich repeat (LRR) protein